MKCHDDEVCGQKLRVFDNGGKTLDRFTIVFMRQRPRYDRGALLRPAIGASMDAEYCEHVEAMCGRHLGQRRKFDTLPGWLQAQVRAELATDSRKGTSPPIVAAGAPHPTKGVGEVPTTQAEPEEADHG